MDIYEILHLKMDSSKEAIKQRYYKLLFQLHPHNHATGCEELYLNLQNAYKKYISGDSFVNCFSVVQNNTGSLLCRCGGMYCIPNEFIGRVECDFCSCFVEVEAPVQLIEM